MKPTRKLTEEKDFDKVHDALLDNLTPQQWMDFFPQLEEEFYDRVYLHMEYVDFEAMVDLAKELKIKVK